MKETFFLIINTLFIHLFEMQKPIGHVINEIIQSHKEIYGDSCNDITALFYILIKMIWRLEDQVRFTNYCFLLLHKYTFFIKDTLLYNYFKYIGNTSTSYSG